MLAVCKTNRGSNLETVQLLLRSGANLDLQNGTGSTALLLAAKFSTDCSNIKTVEILIRSGANLDLPNAGGNTALIVFERDE